MSDGDETVTFIRDGRRVTAKKGQSIGAALWAKGDRALSRSSKYHRPRGWSCGTGKCPDCFMRVDGVPNVRTCITPAAEGMRVESQNAWPSARRDLFRANDLVFRKFDHHRWFVRPRFLYNTFARVIRAFAGWGKVPDAPPAAQGEVRTYTPDVLVVGGGPAGMAAAQAAAETGARVLLVDEATHLGGHAARMATLSEDPDKPGSGPVLAGALVQRWTEGVRAHRNVAVLGHTSLSAAYRNGLFLAHDTRALHAIRPRATVIATGGYHAEAHFVNNDLPGIMSAAGCQALLNREGVKPGLRAVVYGAGAHGLQVALDLHQAGVHVVAVAEPAEAARGPAALRAAIAETGIPLRPQRTLLRADGFGRVKAARLAAPDGTTERIACDTIVVATGTKTAPEFFQALGARLRFEPACGGAVPVLTERLETSVPGVFAAGDSAGIGSMVTARLSGRLAGLAAAAHIGPGLDVFEREQQELSLRLDGLLHTHGGPGAVSPENALHEVPA